MKAVVAGAGIGGLTLSTALAQRGWDVVLLERQREVRTAGSGIYIWENGLRVLDAIGAGGVAEHAFQGLAMELRDHEDRLLDEGHVPAGVRLKTVPRAKLTEGLLAAAQAAGVKIRTSTEVVGAYANGELNLQSGQVESADLVVGADGVWSAVRQSLGLELSHERMIEGGHRALIGGTRDDLGELGQDRYIEVWHGERRLLITPVDESTIYLALACPRYDAAGVQLPLDIADWARHFPRWAHLIQRIDSSLPWSPYSIVKVSRWSAGRAALLGDAAHAQPPNLGQGGGMAMQSGLSLAVHLEDVTDRRDVPDALAAWERYQRPLVDHCQKWSALYSEIAFIPDEVRRQAIRQMMASPWIRRQLSMAARSEPLGTCVAAPAVM
jgi:2-polyprenyl-6-methoxyphenol hydroxylase-like FAD-dependent oxidoreductase